MKLLFILGRQPELGVAEIESLYGADSILELQDNILIAEINEEKINFNRLGGSIKLAQILDIAPLDSLDEAFDEALKYIDSQTSNIESGKVNLGFSAYKINVNVKNLHSLGLRAKKLAKKNGRTARFVPNQELELNSASVIHNKLLSKNGFEIIFAKVNESIYIAKTVNIQNIEAYAKRDQNRPFRDTKVGMLPPKLAQIIINLASGNYKIEGQLLLDPFCGTGVVLQEASLMGYQVMGSDVDDRMVEYTNKNLSWLREKFNHINPPIDIKVGDATNTSWSKFNILASETYLGTPFNTRPSENVLEDVINSVNELLINFLSNLKPQIDQNTGICIAVPAWKMDGRHITLPLIDQIEDLGYNFVDLKHINSKAIFYDRENQIVARQLLILRKR